MTVEANIKRAMVLAMQQGIATPAQVADYLEITKQAVHKWVDAAECSQQFAISQCERLSIIYSYASATPTERELRDFIQEMTF